MKEEKNKKIGIIIGLVLLFITIIGVTYAAFQYTKRGTKENELSTGTVSFVYNETSNGVTLTNAYPLSDSEGKNLTEATEEDNGYFDFNVTSTLGGDITIPYYVYAVDITGDVENKLSEDYVKVYLTDQEDQPLEKYNGEVPLYSDLDDINAQSKEGQEVQGKLLYQNEFTESGVHKYRLRIWVADTYKNSDKAETFKMRVDVNTEAEVVPKDQNKPTCEILNAQPEEANGTQDISMTIKCTDDNGTVTSNMTSENIHVLVDNEEVEPTKKELTEGIAATEVTGENGIQHNLTLSGFEKDGPLSIKIDSGVVQDQYKNTNDEQELSTNVTVNGQGPTCTLEDYFPTKTITKDKTLELTIKCTDDDGISKDLTSDGLKIKVGDEEETELTKEITKTDTIEKGKKYTVEVKEFTKTGKITPIINAEALQDTVENPNKETTLDMDLEIGNTPAEDFTENANSSETEYNDDTKHDMFEFSQPDGSTGYRYIGDDPYNYVQIDGESSLWRIIGVFEDLSSANDKSPRIKLIRDESIGDYSWDNKAKGTGSNQSSSLGSNNWNDATLMNILNSGAYWNKQNGTCSSGTTLGATKSCDFSTTGLSSTLKNKIEEMKWYTGGYDNSQPSGAENYFTQERGSKPAGAPNSTTTWDGFVGLMYLSDNYYTYGNGVDDTCFSNSSNNCDSSNPKKGWIHAPFNGQKTQWTLTPSPYDERSVKLVHSSGSYGNSDAYGERVVRPVVYLKSGTTLGGGDGQKTSPYTIEEKTVADIDLESPICSIESVTPQNPTQEDEVQIKINCTDNSGKVIERTPLIKDDIEVKINGETSSATKELNKTSSTDNEIKYTLTLNNFEEIGSLSINIPANKIYDESGNSNIATSLTAVLIRGKTIDVNGLPSNPKDAEYSDGTKNSMFEFSQPDGSTGYRYIGDDPYNYVKMNDDNSVWRIIGVFNDSDSTGSKDKQRIKLIKDQSVGNIAWDSNNKNNWTKPATLQTDLNSGSTYSSLSATLKGKIDKMKWYLGGYDWSGTPSLTTLFNAERGSNGGNNGSALTTWDGYVGLMYPSDYGYTYEKGISAACTGNFVNCSSDSTKGWIRKGHESEYQWTLTPRSNDTQSVTLINLLGYVNPDWASNEFAVRPVVYLKSGTTFSGGTGTSNSPYILK